jgi:type III pantothenate kinase
MNLIIDIGNTRTKIAFFQKNTLVEKAIVEAVTLDALSGLVKGRNIEGAIMSITGQDTEGVEDWLQKRFFFIKMATNTPLPIENLYNTPQTLGKDRLAAVVAAQFLFPNKNCLVVDSGTCITYNFINNKGQFLGGNIAPGLSMRLKAMHHFTAKLPLIARNTEGAIKKLVGQSTEQAMLNGAQIGLLSEVEGFVTRFKNEFGTFKVLLTGGDGAFLNDNLLVKNKTYEPNLVLMGLNRILNFNRE